MSEETTSTETAPALRMRLPIIVVIIQWVLVYGLGRFGATNVENFLGLVLVPVVCTIILVVWWLRSKTVPKKDRRLGLVVLAVALALVVLLQPRIGYYMLAYALPVTITALVLLLAVTQALAWPTRRALALAVILVSVTFFSMLRVDSVGGNLYPVVAWRWSPDAAERSATLMAEEAHGTANVPATLGPFDWPGFRGANRDNRIAGVNFSTDWSNPPKEVWRREVGPGWSSFVVAGDYIFTQEQRGEDDYLTCYEAATGKPVWATGVPGRFEDPMGLGPRATPAYDRGKVFAISGKGMLRCINAANGETVWQQDVSTDGGESYPQYGYAASPLVVGDNVIVFACGSGNDSLTAYNVNTGEQAWTTAKGTRAYSSPHFATLGGTPQIIMTNNTGVQAFSPDSGAVIWAHEWPQGQYARCTQPMITAEEAIMVGTSGKGSQLVSVKKEGEQWQTAEAWMNKKFQPYFNDGVYHEGYCYGFDGNRLNCIDMKTGEIKWEGDRFGGQVAVLTDMDMLLIMAEKGEVVLVPANPDAYSVSARFKALEGKTWNHPVIANGRLFIRNSAEAACFELPETVLAKAQ